MTSFKDLSLPADALANLASLGYQHPTPIQEKAIGEILLQKDLIAQAKTGSGKTLAFALPLVLKLKESEHLPQALIIAPTRELCEQIATQCKVLARYKRDVKVVSLVPIRPRWECIQEQQ